MENEKIPSFEGPRDFLSPQISNLLHETAFLEQGIAYKGYKRINPDDSSEMEKSGRSINFQIKESAGTTICKLD